MFHVWMTCFVAKKCHFLVKTHDNKSKMKNEGSKWLEIFLKGSVNALGLSTLYHRPTF